MNQTVDLPQSERDSDSDDEQPTVVVEEPHIDPVSEDQHGDFSDEFLRLDTTAMDSLDVVLHQTIGEERLRSL